LSNSKTQRPNIVICIRKTKINSKSVLQDITDGIICFGKINKVMTINNCQKIFKKRQRGV
jgi:hypothetical protein